MTFSLTNWFDQPGFIPARPNQPGLAGGGSSPPTTLTHLGKFTNSNAGTLISNSIHTQSCVEAAPIPIPAITAQSDSGLLLK